LNREILENHKNYLERIALFKSYGYDIERERNFIVEKAKPLYGKILEVGTGKGYFALALAKEGHSFVTIDISKDEQLYAKLNLAYFGVDNLAEFKIENAESTCFPDKYFDIIFSVNIVHHLQNPYKVVNELSRILSSDGKLIISDFTEKGFKIIEKIHALEGKEHETSTVGLRDIELNLKTKGFIIERAESEIQKILIAKKGIH